MSRLSGAVGALRGYTEGRMNDQELKLKLMDTLQSLRQYEQVTLPQSQAMVGATQAQTGAFEAQTAESKARLPGVKAEAEQATTEWGILSDVYQKIRPQLTQEKATKMLQNLSTEISKSKSEEAESKYTEKLAEEKSKQEAYVPEADAYIKEQQRLAALRGWQTEALEAGPTPEAAAKLEWNTKLTQYEMMGIEKDVVSIARDIQEKYGMDKEEANLIAQNLQNDRLQQQVDFVDNQLAEMRKDKTLSKYYTIDLEKGLAEVENLQEQGEYIKANRKLKELMFKAAEKNRLLLFGAQGSSIAGTSAVSTSLSKLLSLMRQASGMTGATVNTTKTVDAITTALGVVANKGKIVGPGEKGDDIDLKKPENKEHLDALNTKLQMQFSGSGFFPRIEVIRDKRWGPIPDKIDVRFIYPEVSELTEQQYNKLSKSEKVMYQREKQAYLKRAELEPLHTQMESLIKLLLEQTLAIQSAELGLGTNIYDNMLGETGGDTDEDAWGEAELPTE